MAAVSPRTTPKAVAEVLGYNYRADDGLSLIPHLRAASILVDRLRDAAASDADPIPASTLYEIETWLAAYHYTLTDPLYTSKSTGGASGSFLYDGDRTKNPYLRSAVGLDPSGLLMGIIDAGRTVGGGWLGKTVSEQVDYADRS